MVPNDSKLPSSLNSSSDSKFNRTYTHSEHISSSRALSIFESLLKLSLDGTILKDHWYNELLKYGASPSEAERLIDDLQNGGKVFECSPKVYKKI